MKSKFSAKPMEGKKPQTLDTTIQCGSIGIQIQIQWWSGKIFLLCSLSLCVYNVYTSWWHMTIQ